MNQPTVGRREKDREKEESVFVVNNHWALHLHQIVAVIWTSDVNRRAAHEYDYLKNACIVTGLNTHYLLITDVMLLLWHGILNKTVH